VVQGPSLALSFYSLVSLTTLYQLYRLFCAEWKDLKESGLVSRLYNDVFLLQTLLPLNGKVVVNHDLNSVWKRWSWPIVNGSFGPRFEHEASGI